MTAPLSSTRENTMTDTLANCWSCGARSPAEDFDKWALVRNIAHFIRCPECHSRTGNWGSREAAIAAWNRRSVPSPDVAVLREALVEIARQKLCDELTNEEYDNADINGGYDECIRRARQALAGAGSDRRASPPDLEGVTQELLLAADAVLVKYRCVEPSIYEARLVAAIERARTALSSLPNSPGGVGDAEALLRTIKISKVYGDWYLGLTIADGACWSVMWPKEGLRVLEQWKERLDRALATAPTAEGK